MFTSIAYAAGNAGGSAPGGMGAFASFLPLILMFAVFYFLLIRPQQKRNKEHKNMVNSLGKGAYVMTSAGFLGRVVDVKGDLLTVNIGDETGKEILVKMPKGFISGTYDPKALEKTPEAAAEAKK